MAQTFCHACYGTSLTYENGVLVCDACGTQTQNIQEETEFQQGIDDARGRRRAAGSLAASQALSQAALIAQEEQQAAAQLKDAALLYVRCLQHLLKLQGQVLVSRFGVSPQLPSLLRQMWLSHLPTTGILEPKPHRHRSKGLASSTAAAGAGAAGAAAADGDESDGEEAADEQGGLGKLAGLTAAKLVMPYNMKRLLWKLLHPQVTLQLCFLGCVLLRECVTFFDIMTWALDGQLPFLELPHLSSQVATGDALSCLPVRIIQAQLMLDPMAFCSSSCRLAERLGLQLPPVCGEGLLLRAVKDLGLPQVVYEAALQLHILYLMNTPRLQLGPFTSRTQTHPYVWLAAALLVTIKLLYGLGGAAGRLPLLPKAEGPPGGWQGWAQQVVAKLPGVSSLPLTEGEVLELGQVEVRQYINFCRQYMFAGQPIVKTMDDVQRLLSGWYDASDPAGRPAGQQQQQGRSAAPGTATARTAGYTGADTAGETSRAAGTASTPPSVGAAGAASASQQQQFVLDPSRRELCNYSLSVGSNAGKASATVRLEPELAAVAVAVAGYAHVGSTALMDCVRKLEKQMLAVESAVKVMGKLNATAGQAG